MVGQGILGYLSNHREFFFVLPMWVGHFAPHTSGLRLPQSTTARATHTCLTSAATSAVGGNISRGTLHYLPAAAAVKALRLFCSLKILFDRRRSSGRGCPFHTVHATVGASYHWTIRSPEAQPMAWRAGDIETCIMCDSRYHMSLYLTEQITAKAHFN